MSLKVNRDDLYLKVSKITGVPPKEVKKAVHAQFKLVENTIRSGSFEAVRLPYFGIFKVNPKRLEFLQTLTRKKK